MCKQSGISGSGWDFGSSGDGSRSLAGPGPGSERAGSRKPGSRSYRASVLADYAQSERCGFGRTPTQIRLPCSSLPVGKWWIMLAAIFAASARLMP